MADDKKVFSILKEAKKQGLIKPSQVTKLCFVSYINTANHILFQIKENSEEQLSTEEIIKRTELNSNTCKIYLRTLEKLNFINRVKFENTKKTVWKIT